MLKEMKIYVCQYIESVKIEGILEMKFFVVNVVLFEVEDEEEVYQKVLYGIEIRDGYWYKNDFGEVVCIWCLGIKDICFLVYSWKELMREIKERDGYDMVLVWFSEMNCNEIMIMFKEMFFIFNLFMKDKRLWY